jgi:hypothetical protein
VGAFVKQRVCHGIGLHAPSRHGVEQDHGWARSHRAVL